MQHNIQLSGELNHINIIYISPVLKNSHSDSVMQYALIAVAVASLNSCCCSILNYTIIKRSVEGLFLIAIA